MNRSTLAFLLAVFVAGAAYAQNDECIGALTIGTGTNPAPAASGNTFTMTGATLSAGWPNPPACIASTMISADVWFSFAPATTGVYRIDTEWPVGFAPGTLTDTTLEVFPDTLCVPGPSIACDDDSGVTSSFLSLLTVPLNAGSVYYVRVGDWGTFSGGTFYLNVTFLGLPPGNDDCGTSVTIAAGTNPAPAASGNTFSNAVATTSAGWATNCSGVNIAKDVWFDFTATMSGLHQIDTETPAGFAIGTITDTVLEIHNGACVVGPALACDDDAGTTGTGLLSICVVNLTAGSTYKVRVGAYSLATVTEGTFYINVSFIGPPLPNDDCGAGAVALSLGANPTPAAPGNTFNNLGTTTTAGYPAACATIMNDVWFSFTPAVSDTYVFDTNTPCGFTAGTMTNTTMALYDAAACTTPAAALACDADSGTGSLSLLQAALIAGNTYYLRVGPTTNVFQTFYVNVRQGAIATNNECASPITVTVGTNPAPAASCNYFTNDLATSSAGWPTATPTICATLVNDVWFSFTPAASGPYIIDTSTPCGFTPGTALNTTLIVYDSSCNSAVPGLACDADAGTLTLSSVNISLTGGSTYLIRVGTTAATGAGTFYLNIAPGTVGAPNDTCATAITVGTGTNPAPAASCNTFANDFATSDTLGYPAVCGTIVNDVWFVFTPPISGDYRFDTETPAGFATGTNTNSTLAIYPGCGVGPALACDADAGVTGTGLMSVVNVNGLVGGVPVYIRVGSTSATVAGTFYLNITRIFAVAFSSPFGPGSLQFDISAGPANGTYYLAISLNAGAFPNGWLYGVDIWIQEVLDELATGYPFVGPLNANGDSVFGPIAGIPAGLTIYAVGIGFAGAVVDFPVANTAPKTYTIP
jgi:hypothetical protein